MKNIVKIIFITIVAVVAIISSGCQYDEYDIQYPHTSVLFVYQDYVSNIVHGEGLVLNVGISFAGIAVNDKDRHVEYIIDPELMNYAPPGMTELPDIYYTRQHPSQIVIPKGTLRGWLPVTLDSLAFLNDQRSLTGEFVLPMRLISTADNDSINPEKAFTRISISYFGKQHGFYRYTGEAERTFDGVVFDVNNYRNTHVETNSIRFVQTAGPTKFKITADPLNRNDALRVYAIDGSQSGVVSFFVNIPDVYGTNVIIEPDLASPFEVYPTGENTFDPVTRTFNLSYAFMEDARTERKIVEELVFRNRIRDDQGNGIFINEWRFSD